MTREAILTQALFDTGGEIQGIKFRPLSIPARDILLRRRNTSLGEFEREQTEAHAVAEVFFVLTRTPEQRGMLTRAPDDEWDALVTEFQDQLPEGVLEEFVDYLVTAAAAIQAAAVESEDMGKSRPAPAKSRGSSKQRKGLDSSGSRKRSK